MLHSRHQCLTNSAFRKSSAIKLASQRSNRKKRLLLRAHSCFLYCSCTTHPASHPCPLPILCNRISCCLEKHNQLCRNMDRPPPWATEPSPAQRAPCSRRAPGSDLNQNNPCIEGMAGHFAICGAVTSQPGRCHNWNWPPWGSHERRRHAFRAVACKTRCARL